jgi:hypothetical protein
MRLGRHLAEKLVFIHVQAGNDLYMTFVIF